MRYLFPPWIEARIAIFYLKNGSYCAKLGYEWPGVIASRNGRVWLSSDDMSYKGQKRQPGCVEHIGALTIEFEMFVGQ